MLRELVTFVLICGDHAFFSSFPYVCVSIGFTIKREIVLGIVYIPVLDDMYSATKGGGAFLNDKKLAVSGQEGKHEIKHNSIFVIGLHQALSFEARESDHLPSLT